MLLITANTSHQINAAIIRNNISSHSSARYRLLILFTVTTIYYIFNKKKKLHKKNKKFSKKEKNQTEQATLHTRGRGVEQASSSIPLPLVCSLI